MQDERGEKNSRGGIMVGMGMRGSGHRGPHWGVISGGILATVGLLILLDNMGIHAVSNIYRFWPVILIFVGVWNLFCASSRVFGIVLIILGVLFQLDTLGVAHFSWGELWPLAIIGAGLVVMWSSLQARRVSKVVGDALGGHPQTDPRTTLNEVAIFGGIERRITSQDFQGGYVQAVFGGVELDLREANMQQDEVKLEINAVFGGVELRVPDTWQVVSRGQAFFGGFADNTRNYRSENPANPGKKSLLLTGSAVFGGVEIKN